MEKKWFVVQTKSKQEDHSLSHLKDKAVEVYLPKMEVMTFHARRRIINRKPLFPSYLFVHVDADNVFNKVRWTKGVVKVLLNFIHPVPVDDGIIGQIRSLEDSDGIIRFKPRPSKKHERVRITRGPFKDITGIIDYWSSDRERVKILLDVISYQASIELHPSLIERVA